MFWCCPFHCGLFGAPACHPIIMEAVFTMGKINHGYESNPEHIFFSWVLSVFLCLYTAWQYDNKHNKQTLLHAEGLRVWKAKASVVFQSYDFTCSVLLQTVNQGSSRALRWVSRQKKSTVFSFPPSRGEQSYFIVACFQLEFREMWMISGMNDIYGLSKDLKAILCCLMFSWWKHGYLGYL